jgi:lysophospholipase L1-like esterase
MKKRIAFILPVILLIYIGCISRNKVFREKQTIITQCIIPDSLYPSPALVIPYHSDWTKKHYPEKIQEFKKQPLQFGDIVFLGNSITEFGGDWGKRLNSPIIKNRGISGDVTAGVLQRLGEVYYVKPKAVFLLIGINDLFNPKLSSDSTAANIIKIVTIIHKKSPHTKIYVQTILPTSTQTMVDKIKKTNDILASNARPRLYTLINIHVLLADDQDLIKKEYTRDGVHLTEAAYVVWVDYLRKYFNKYVTSQ